MFLLRDVLAKCRVLLLTDIAWVGNDRSNPELGNIANAAIISTAQNEMLVIVIGNYECV